MTTTIGAVLSQDPIAKAILDYVWTNNVEGYRSLTAIIETEGRVSCDFNRNEAKNVAEVFGGYAFFCSQASVNLQVKKKLSDICFFGFKAFVSEVDGSLSFDVLSLTFGAVKSSLRCDKNTSPQRRELMSSLVQMMPRITKCRRMIPCYQYGSGIKYQPSSKLLNRGSTFGI